MRRSIPAQPLIVPSLAEQHCLLYMRVAFLAFAFVLFCGCHSAANKRGGVPPSDEAGLPGVKMPVTLLVKSSEVQQALEIVDAVVRRHGLISLKHYPKSQTKVVRYYSLSLGELKTTPSPSLTCTVYLKGQTLEVVFLEFSKWNLSSDVRQMSGEIRSEFVNRFGNEKVR